MIFVIFPAKAGISICSLMRYYILNSIYKITYTFLTINVELIAALFGKAIIYSIFEVPPLLIGEGVRG